jgi:hypothetical protein
MGRGIPPDNQGDIRSMHFYYGDLWNSNSAMMVVYPILQQMQMLAHNKVFYNTSRR